MKSLRLDQELKGEDLRLFLQEKLILDVTSKVCELMEEQEISRAELSRLLNTSKGYVTQMLDGSRNLTLRTLSDVFLALNKEVFIRTRELGCTGKPVELHLAGEVNWPRRKSPWDFTDEPVVLDVDTKKVVA